MPELPEVETVLRTLENQIKNLEICDVDVYWKNIIQGDVSEFVHNIKNEHFRDFYRRGKYLIFKLDHFLLVSHLRMEGKYFYKNSGEGINKHEHIVFKLSNGKELRYHDTRKFGRMELLPMDTNLREFKNLGPEPWDEAFNPQYCYEQLRKRTGSIKAALLDQSFVAGVGNIYADEICFKMKVNPKRSCKKITKKNCVDCVQSTRDILAKAIECGGTTIRSYTSSLGITGLFQLEVLVHGKKGELCPICDTPIKKIKVATRGTYYCPHCQKR